MIDGSSIGLTFGLRLGHKLDLGVYLVTPVFIY